MEEATLKSQDLPVCLEERQQWEPEEMGGSAQITSSDGSISVGLINVSGGNSTVAVGGNSGNVSLQPTNATGAQNIALGTVALNQNVVAKGGTGTGAGVDGSVTISAARSASVSTATITSSLVGNDVLIETGTFIMGDFEVITVLGDLTVTASQSMTIGDSIALVDLNYTAPTINLLVHGPYEILSSLGALYPSPDLHVYGGNSETLVGTLMPTGPLDQQNFASTYTESQFRNLLILDGASNILNFNQRVPDPPPAPSAPSAAQPNFGLMNEIVYDMTVANAQLAYILEQYELFSINQAQICTQGDRNECLALPKPPEMRRIREISFRINP